MKIEEERVYFRKQRSGRNWSVVGGLFLAVAVIGILYLVASASWLSWWFRIPAIAGIVVFGLLSIKSVGYLIRNPVVELNLSKKGIIYGSLYYPWKEIHRIYPRGGLTIFGKRRYQLGYSLKKGMQRTNDLPVDGGISRKEFTEMIERIEAEVYPHFQHLKLRKP